ncbi:MAG: O-acetyl-ADP-ribose deacetylase [Bryobacteraceae bacterium]|jgi:O-acetyl-ADP-ribose deacetylase (regulator of RNase III)
MQWTAHTGKTLKLATGDITRVAADAIVNAANLALAGGGGVDGAIHCAGGPSLMAELDQIRPRIGQCPTGSAVVTGAGALPARHVFHAVGPVYRDGLHGEPELLASCYRKCFELAQDCGARSISFPAISTGVYGYPLRAAAQIAVREVARQLERTDCDVAEATFVLFDRKAFEAFAQAVAELAQTSG